MPRKGLGPCKGLGPRLHNMSQTLDCLWLYAWTIEKGCLNWYGGGGGRRRFFLSFGCVICTIMNCCKDVQVLMLHAQTCSSIKSA